MDIKNNFIRELQQLFLSMREISKDIAKLMLLETKLAKKSLIKIIELTFLIIILIFATWFSFMAMIASGLHNIGLGWVTSFFVITLINASGLLAGYTLILKHAQNLTFRATRKQLKGTPQ